MEKTPVEEFFLKKFEREISRQNYLLVQLKTGEPFVVEERLFYFMLKDSKFPAELIELNYAKSLGIVNGINGGAYEAFKLSDKGELAYFSTFNREVLKYKEAFDAINQSRMKNNLVVQIGEIFNFYQKNKIKVVVPFERIKTRAKLVESPIAA